uniref:Takeout n=1 Tax=Glossina morsitans morsitans TaxID=37546 RepID=D3TQK8_GLOMM
MLTRSFKSLLIGLLCASLKAEFPNDPKPCNYGDTECIKKITSYYLSKKEGDNSINLSQVDPLIPNKIHINQGTDSPVNIDIVLTNNKIYGTSNAVVTKVTGFGKDLTKKHSITIQVPGAVSLLGDYVLSGKVLILPIQGEGKSNLTLVNTVFSIDFVGMADEKDGEVYMKLKNFHLHVDPQSFIFHFDNLFNGDKALGDNMNKFLNENWKEIFNELRASIEKEFGAVVDKVISQVYTKYPYAKYFNE